ncbi:16809_t:CDS:2, partial [Acaulospora colombiana]
SRGVRGAIWLLPIKAVVPVLGMFSPRGMAGGGSAWGDVEEEDKNEDTTDEKREEGDAQTGGQKVWVLYPSKLPLQSDLTETAVQSCAGFLAEYKAYIETLWALMAASLRLETCTKHDALFFPFLGEMPTPRPRQLIQKSRLPPTITHPSGFQ